MEDIPWMEIREQPESLIDIYPRSQHCENNDKENKNEPDSGYINFNDSDEIIIPDEFIAERTRKHITGDFI